MSAKTELSKALTTGSTDGGDALAPYNLDPILHEELLKLQPLAQLLDVVPAGGKTHEYSVRSSHPQGWFEGEVTPANAKNSAYQRLSTQLKIQRIWGSVTGFAQAMDEMFIDAFATELEGSLEGMSNVLEYGVLWGCDNAIGFTGDAYQYSGIFPRIAKFAPGNIINAAGAKVSLDLLDQGIAKVTRFRGTSADPKMWMMGLRMRQVVDGLQTRVQIPLTSTVLNDGKLVMANYGNAPILESDYVVPEDETTSPTVAGAAAAGGSLAADDYLYRIASVTVYGEQVAGVAGDAVTVDGTTNGSVELTWDADTNAVLYEIFRSLDGTTYQLLDVIPALTYDTAGTVNGAVETYVDDGSKTPITTVEPLEAGEQNIFLINRNSRRGMAILGKVDDMGRPVNNLMSFVELARIKDTYDYLLKSYLGARMVYPNIAAAIIRRVKLTAS